MLAAGDPGYDEARAIWNAMIDRRPAIIGRCLGVSDVINGLAADLGSVSATGSRD